MQSKFNGKIVIAVGEVHVLTELKCSTCGDVIPRAEGLGDVTPILLLEDGSVNASCQNCKLMVGNQLLKQSQANIQELVDQLGPPDEECATCTQDCPLAGGNKNDTDSPVQ